MALAPVLAAALIGCGLTAICGLPIVAGAAGASGPRCRINPGHGVVSPTRISIQSAPDPAQAGSKATVFGRLFGRASGGRLRPAPLCDATVSLWARLPYKQRFAAIAIARTGPTGRFHIVLPSAAVQSNQLWFVAVNPRGAHGAAKSALERRSVPGPFSTGGTLLSRILSERVQAVLTLQGSATFAVSGDSETFSGQVSPAQPRQQAVLAQRRWHGRWLTEATLSLQAGQRFSFSHTFTQAGVQRWRVLLAGAPLAIPPRRATAACAGPAPGPQARGGLAVIDCRNARSSSPTAQIRIASATGIHKIKHVVVIMQENRSFDSYFGTYPGADGIPAGTCVPDPLHGGCVAPFHNSAGLNYGGPHDAEASSADIAGGAMNGFVGEAEAGQNCTGTTTNPGCSPCTQGEGASEAQQARCVDVMGYHDAREIPNYWAYAQSFVLQDHMFSQVGSWSLPAHLYLVSEWSAFCTNAGDPFSCTGALEGPNNPPLTETNPQYAWTDLTWLLHRQNVSWGYYIFQGQQPECVEDPSIGCQQAEANKLYSGQSAPGTGQTPGIWDSLRWFTDVRENEQLQNVQSVADFLAQAKEGTLPSVSWVAPSYRLSEHPQALVGEGQAYVTGLIDAVMQSPDWDSTAIFLSWDDWGGFYDHVLPPVVDAFGYGLRVPGLVVSPYAKQGYLDHQTLSHDAYNKFIEDDFLGSERLNPATDGRPDPRPSVREENPLLGNLEADFQFQQTPRPPLLLPVDPPPGPASSPP